jgi:DNA-binding response OmpR family regulator
VGTVLILEPQPELAELFARLAGRLGHDAVAGAEGASSDLHRLDAVVLEPRSSLGLRIARQLRARDPTLPIVCVSVLPLTPAARELAPAAFLLKPFGNGELEQTLRAAIADRGDAGLERG